MPPARDSDGSSDPDDDEDLEEEAPRPRRPARRATRPKGHRPSVRRWQGADDEDDDEELEATPARRRWFPRESHPVYWRARDSLYFEPLVAVAIIVVLVVSLYAYTQNWPPVYVVESESMQHGSSDVLGVINTGDLVLAQRVPVDQITPYVVGLQTGYSTYGEYGDVILYLPNGGGSTPVIHRAILFLQWDPITSTYNATDLSGLKCGNATGAVYATTGTTDGCGLTGLGASNTLYLYGVGWKSVNVCIPLDPALLGKQSGFVTMGDNNIGTGGCGSGNWGLPDQTDGLSTLVETGWIVGVARGMIPWFGAVKLLLEGNAGEVPIQSWEFLGITVVSLILLAFGIHYALRAEGIEDERRKRPEEDDEYEGEDDEPPPGRGRRFLRAIRPWGHGEEEEDVDAPPARSHRPPRGKTGESRRGRPKPRVRRDSKAKSSKSSEDDDL